MSIFEFESPAAWVSEVFPNGVPSKRDMKSLELYEDNKQEWKAAQRRLLAMSITGEDDESTKAILHDIASVIGINESFNLFLLVWQILVEKKLDELLGVNRSFDNF